MNRFFLIIIITAIAASVSAQPSTFNNPKLVPITKGWAKNQINAVIFRRNSVTTYKSSQYVAFYDPDSRIVLAKRNLETNDWSIYKTEYEGNVKDAHNSISIAVDGDGFLHVAWSHHDTPLQYCRSTGPGSLKLTSKMSMLGNKEDRLTYPEFYNLPNGNLLFLYRDGASGNGNLILNHYDLKSKKWSRLQDKLIDGEGQRNAYWQTAVDVEGNIHISWVWRESPDVASNHDMCYAKSTDVGKTWKKSSGEKYQLPITAKSAEYVYRIPQGSELINQTSMCVDGNGRPYIATYWRPQETKIPQYHLIYYNGKQWLLSQVTRRTTPFSLSGGGTKRIPISRPQIVVNSSKSKLKAFMIFRDSERGNHVSVAMCDDLNKEVWLIKDLMADDLGMWEPTYDQLLWNRKKELHLFVQRVGQGDSESTENIPAQMVSILEWVPKR